MQQAVGRVISLAVESKKRPRTHGDLRPSNNLCAARARGGKIDRRLMVFRFQCLRELKTRLGEVDSTVEIMEVALRSLRSACKAGADPGGELARVAASHGIRVNLSVFPTIEQAAVRSYVSMAFAEFDAFLGELKTSHRELFQSNWAKRDGESSFGRARRVVEHHGSSSWTAEAKLAFALLDYVRLLRNDAAHGANADAVLGVAHSELMQNETVMKQRYGVVPSAPSALAFDDFVLAARVAYDAAEALVTMSDPGDTVLRTIATQIALLFRSRADTSKAHRLENAVASVLVQRYSLERSRANSIARDACVCL